MFFKKNFKIFVISSLFVGSVFATDWSTGRYNYLRNANTPESISTNLAIAWRWKSEALPHPAWFGPAREDAYMNFKLRPMRNYDLAFDPIIVGNRIFWGSSADNSLYCVNSGNGKVIWRYITDGAIHTAPTYSNGRIYFGSDDGYAYCLNAKTGKLIWKYSPTENTPFILHDDMFISQWPCRAGIIIDDNIAYVSFSMMPWEKTYLCALNADTGKISGTNSWQKEYSGLSQEGLPVLSGDKLIYPQGRITPVVFNRKDGTKVGNFNDTVNWSASGFGGSFIVADDGIIAYGPGNRKNYGPATVPNRDWGAEVFSLKKRKFVRKFPDAMMMVFDEDHAYAMTPNSVYAVDKNNITNRLWQYSTDTLYVIIKAGNVIYAGSDNAVIALNAVDGNELWKIPVNGRVHSLAAGNGILIAGTDLGEMICMRKSSTTHPSPVSSDVIKNIKKAVAGISDKHLFNCWNFSELRKQDSEYLRDETGRMPAELSGKYQMVEDGNSSFIVLDGKTTTIRMSDDLSKCKLPEQKISVVAWVNIGAFTDWGSIIGAFQDNGTFERGWTLGYRKDRFSFAVAAGKISTNPPLPRLKYLKAPNGFKCGEWYCVAGTYDGSVMKLYINGKEVASSTAEKGAIAYPDSGYYEIGAFHDANDNIKMSGMINEVRVYDTVLSPKKIAELSAPRKYLDMAKITLNMPHPPTLSFTSLDSALLTFWTPEKTGAEVKYEYNDKKFTIKDSVPGFKHVVTLKNLPHNRIVKFTVTAREGNKQRVSKTYSIDTLFNFSVPQLKLTASEKLSKYARQAANILKMTPERKGICLVGNGDWRLARAIAAASDFHVVCFSGDSRVVADAREKLMTLKSLYGSRITAIKWNSDDLKLIQDGSVTLLVDSIDASGKPVVSLQEAERITRPSGGVSLLCNFRGKSGITIPDGWTAINKGGIIAGYKRGKIIGAGAWTHQYGKPDNSTYVGETLSDAKSKEDLRLQWIGRPGPRFRADRNGRGSAPLAVDGRLFVLGLGRILGMDAYTGTVLWTRTLPGVNRFNIQHDSGNWCADEKNLYIPLGAECLIVDNKTGELKKWFKMPVKDNQHSICWSYIARENNLLFGSATTKGSRYTDFHGAYGWYDGKSDPIRAMVCSAEMFALNANNGSRVWNYSPQGVIVNPTITIADGKVFFIEADDVALRQEKKYRFTANRISTNSVLVALDAATGKKIWSKKVELNKNNELKYPVEAVFLAYSDGLLTFLTSRTDQKPLGTYYLTVLNAADGTEKYTKEFKWGQKDHGGHLSRPVIANGRLNIRPKTFELQTGKVLNKNKFWGSCGTYVASKNMLIMRTGGCITLWHLDGEQWVREWWSRLRPSCWISTVPACGMLLAPEGGGGCRCGVWMETSTGFIPKNMRTTH